MPIEAFHACIVQASAAPRVTWACSYVLHGLYIGSTRVSSAPVTVDYGILWKLAGIRDQLFNRVQC